MLQEYKNITEFQMIYDAYLVSWSIWLGANSMVELSV